jgi:hypothetical protein
MESPVRAPLLTEQSEDKSKSRPSELHELREPSELREESVESVSYEDEEVCLFCLSRIYKDGPNSDHNHYNGLSDLNDSILRTDCCDQLIHKACHIRWLTLNKKCPFPYCNKDV